MWWLVDMMIMVKTEGDIRIGAKIHEAQNAKRRQDFIHKFKIISKETEETEYWLLIYGKTKTFPSSETLLSSLIDVKNYIM